MINVIKSNDKNFDKQMQFLVKNGYKTLSSEEFLRYKKINSKSLKKVYLLLLMTDGGIIIIMHILF